MKKKITLAIVVIIILLGFIKHKSVENFFLHKRYYPAFVALRLAEPRYSAYKHFYKVFEQEGLDFKKTNDQILQSSLNKLNNADLNVSEMSIIPTITHTIYFVDNSKSIKLDNYYIENLILSYNNLDKLNDAWQHNIWTNDPSLFPDEIKNLSNVKIRNIEEFQGHKLYQYLYNILAKSKESKAYLAESSDILRLMVLQKFGGIYKDMDYEIYSPNALLDLMKKFAFIAGREGIDFKRFYGNAFIASKPNHPVINEALRLLYRNAYLYKDSPDYIKYPTSEHGRLYSNGPVLLTMAYFKKNNIDGNSDIILPSWMLYNVDFIRSKNKSCDLTKITRSDLLRNNANLDILLAEYTSNLKEILPYDGKLTDNEENIYYSYKYHNSFPIIGADMFCGSWTADNKFPKLYYWKIPFFNETKK